MSKVISYRMRTIIGDDTEQTVADELKKIADKWYGLTIREPRVVKNKQGQTFLYFHLFGVI